MIGGNRRVVWLMESMLTVPEGQFYLWFMSTPSMLDRKAPYRSQASAMTPQKWFRPAGGLSALCDNTSVRDASPAPSVLAAYRALVIIQRHLVTMGLQASMWSRTLEAMRTLHIALTTACLYKSTETCDA